jgi:hypothetical protein
VVYDDDHLVVVAVRPSHEKHNEGQKRLACTCCSDSNEIFTLVQRTCNINLKDAWLLLECQRHKATYFLARPVGHITPR